MRARRLFVTEEEVTPEGVVFSRKHAHYLRGVLRLKPGDLVEVLDKRNRSLVKLHSPAEGVLCGTIVESHPVVGPTEGGVTLAFACVRPGPIEDILQHGTEVGVGKFVPILTIRSVRRPRVAKDRWASILAAAAAQSRRSLVPELSPPVSYGNFLSTLEGRQIRLLLSPREDASPILNCLAESDFGECIILVGPEGGFDASEESAAIEEGFIPVSLGAGLLRSETAAIVAAGAVAMWRQWQAFREN